MTRRAQVFTIATLSLLSTVLAQPAIPEATAQSPNSAARGRAELGTARMLRQLEQRDWILRADALTYLARHRVLEAAAPCRKILADDTVHSWLRGQALIALASIAGSKAIEEVLTFAGHQAPALRAATAGALESILEHDSKGLGERLPRLETGLQQLLGDQIMEVQLRALAVHARLHGAAAWSMVESRVKAAGASKSLDPTSARWAARALAWVGTVAAFERLAALAKEGTTLAGILRGLDGVRRPGLLTFLLETIQTLDFHDRRFAALLSLLQQQDRPSVVVALRAMLVTKKASAVLAAARIVSRLVRVPELGGPLRQALGDDPRPDTLYAGLVALGAPAMDPDRHRVFFSSFLEHADPEIRTLAIRCLSHCASANLYRLFRPCVVDENAAVARAALGTLLRTSQEQAPKGKLVKFLERSLTSEDETVRELAFRLLGHAGTEADFPPAVRLLEPRLRGTDSPRRLLAARALGHIAPADKIGGIARTQGYLENWMVLGTFLNDISNAGFNKSFPPEDGIDFDAKYTAKYVWTLEGNRRDKERAIEREIQWNEAKVDQADGKLILPPNLPPPASLAVAFAVADFYSATARRVTLSVDGDDAFRVWLNGKKVCEAVGDLKPREASAVERETAELELQAGANRLVIKTSNIGHEWWLRVRITDSAGRPVKVSTR